MTCDSLKHFFPYPFIPRTVVVVIFSVSHGLVKKKLDQTNFIFMTAKEGLPKAFR